MHAIVALVSISLFAQSPQDLSPRQIFDLASPSVATIVSSDIDGGSTQGSGFVIAPNMLATCWHVVSGAKSATATFIGGKKVELKIVAANPKSDVALLHFDEEVKPLLASADSTKPGDRLYVIGAPEGLEGSITEGLMSQQRKVGDNNVLQISNPVTHGNSGGPVLNSQGKVIGMVSFAIEGSSALNFAVPTADISSLKPSSAPVSFTQFALNRSANCHTFVNRSRQGDVCIGESIFEVTDADGDSYKTRTVMRQEVISVKDQIETRRITNLEAFITRGSVEEKMELGDPSTVRLDQEFNRVLEEDQDTSSHALRILRAQRFHLPKSLGRTLSVGETWSLEFAESAEFGLPAAVFRGHFEDFESVEGVKCARVRTVFEETGIAKPLRYENVSWHVYGMEVVKSKWTTTNYPTKDGLLKIANQLRVIYWKNGPAPFSAPSRATNWNLPAKAPMFKNIVMTDDDKSRKPKLSFGIKTKIIYAYFDLEDVPPGTKIKGAWYCDKSAVTTAPNYKIDEATVETEGDSVEGNFSLSKPDNDWPAGDFRVDLCIGEKVIKSVKFKIVSGLGSVAPPAKGLSKLVAGSWKLELTQETIESWPPGTSLPTFSMQFNANGTWSGEANIGGTRSTAKGYWKLSGRKLTVTTTHEDGKKKKSSKSEIATLSEDGKSFALPGAENRGKMVRQ